MGLWMRQDGDAPNLAFATMQPRQIRGTNDWTEYSITFPLHRDAKQLFFGVLDRRHWQGLGGRPAAAG